LAYSRPATDAADFDWLAPHYRWMEWLLAGKKLQKCRAAFLPAIPAPHRALVVGEGHGPFVAALLKAHPNVHCTCVDASARMLEATRDRLNAAGLAGARVEFVHADVLKWKAPGAYDLIATHFVLDCFRPDQLDRVSAQLAAIAAPGANWLLADFQEPPAGPAKWRARAILEMMYLFFRWATGLPASKLTPPDNFLARHGFLLRQRETFEWGLLHSDLWVRGETPNR
ncbi:MAG TPA: class I SAM-dependent methyltransferase, partial [Verrucomicrobiae bacterium]|nr:class I SAM-dependent methyltransferase [Verrucomicrobiae bacterium]